MPVFLISGPSGQGRDKFAKALSNNALDLSKARLTHPISYPLDLKKTVELFAREEMCVVVGLSTMVEVDFVRRSFPERSVFHCHCRVDAPTAPEEQEMLVEADFVVADVESMAQVAFLDNVKSSKREDVQ